MNHQKPNEKHRRVVSCFIECLDCEMSLYDPGRLQGLVCQAHQNESFQTSGALMQTPNGRALVVRTQKGPPICRNST